MDQNPLLADPQAPALESLTSKDTQVVLVVKTIQSVAPCPNCHQPSSRVHSRYQRTVADLPCLGVTVQIQLHTRRFFCTNKMCARRIFCERLPPKLVELDAADFNSYAYAMQQADLLVGNRQ